MTDDFSETSRAQQPIELGTVTMISARDGDVHTICLRGELDLATAGGVQRELERVEDTDAKAIVLDLSGLTFMDSTGLRLVMSAHARSRADANRLRLMRGSRAVQRVFELTGVEQMLPFAD